MPRDTKDAAVTPADPESTVVLDSWNEIAYGIIEEHSGEHYGQLVVYYRLAPPESRPEQ
jgi:hypothetical protein